MKIKPFRAVMPKMNFVASPNAFFKSVRQKYPDYKRGNFFKKASQEAIYIYRIEKAKKSHLGLITCAHVKDFISNRIKKHENTLSAKEQQQIDLMMKRSAVVKPILVFYEEVKKLTSLINQTIKNNKKTFEVHIKELKETHSIWEVTDGKKIETIISLFKDNIQEAYIADGHHRSSANALMYKRLKEERAKENPYEYLMTAFFPSHQLEIFDFNRIVDGKNNLSTVHLMAELAKVFDIEYSPKPIKPKSKFELSLFIDSEWFKLNWKKEVLKKYSKTKVVLDASLLNELVLDNLLEINDVRTDTRISYAEGIKPIKEFISSCEKEEARYGFLLYPVLLEDLIKVADKKMIMPPKSTWFEPRMKNGLLVQEH